MILNTSVVTPELFSVFGIAPIAGRQFTSEDGKPGSPTVVILSESLWRGTFGGNRAILGTSCPQILKMALRETLTLAAIGLALGIPAFLAASRLLGSMLFGVSAGDSLTLAAVGMSLTAVTAATGYLPARRALRIDPLLALWHE